MKDLNVEELQAINGGGQWEKNRLLGGYVIYSDFDNDGIWDMKTVWAEDGSWKRTVQR